MADAADLQHVREQIRRLRRRCRQLVLMQQEVQRLRGRLAAAQDSLLGVRFLFSQCISGRLVEVEVKYNVGFHSQHFSSADEASCRTEPSMMSTG